MKSKKAPKKPRKGKKAKGPLVSAERSTAAGGAKDAGSASTGALDSEVPVGSQSLPLAKAGFTELITEVNNLIAQVRRRKGLSQPLANWLTSMTMLRLRMLP
jgi:hypothetical protein